MESMVLDTQEALNHLISSSATLFSFWTMELQRFGHGLVTEQQQQSPSADCFLPFLFGVFDDGCDSPLKSSLFQTHHISIPSLPLHRGNRLPLTTPQRVYVLDCFPRIVYECRLLFFLCLQVKHCAGGLAEVSRSGKGGVFPLALLFYGSQIILVICEWESWFYKACDVPRAFVSGLSL